MTDASSHPAWRDYEARMRFFGWAALGFIPGTLATFALLRIVTRWEGAFGLAATAWLGLIAVAAWRYQSFRCPRCGKSFHMGFLRHDPIAPRCLHCRLPRWADPQTGTATRSP